MLKHGKLSILGHFVHISLREGMKKLSKKVMTGNKNVLLRNKLVGQHLKRQSGYAGDETVIWNICSSQSKISPTMTKPRRRLGRC
jgi:hypothetical protein